jgi:HSP20 family molecular chaperone IbpA
MYFASPQSPLAASLTSALNSPLRRPAYAQAGRAAEQFLNHAVAYANRNNGAYTQDETQFTLRLDVPGVSKEQLRIAIEGAVVRIESKEDAPRSYRSAYEFPQEIDSASSTAKLENGVLTLTLVKKIPLSHAAKLAIN